VNLILLGAPGSGKGTQAERLAERFGVPQVATGNILKKARRERTPLGTRAQEFLDKGLLVPDEIVVGIVVDRLAEEDCRKGFVLDGFPRTVPQADALSDILEKSQRRIDASVLLEVERAELLKRLTGRWTCPKDSMTYHVIFNPPRNPGVCDKCNSELYQREDDQEDTIIERLRVYQEQTEPLVDYYQRRNLLRRIAASGTIEEIFDRIVGTLEGVGHVGGAR
jgi:adenylate kinase